MRPSNASEYFQELNNVAVTGEQERVANRVKELIRELNPAHLQPGNTSAALANGDLILKMVHDENSAVYVKAVVDGDGRVDLLCPALHPTFGLRFNDRWDPDDSLGDEEDALETLSALIVGRVKSQLTWSGDVIGASKDILIREDGTPVTLYRQYHGLGGLAGVLCRGRREVRRVSFVSESA
ncbi:MAG: hypothetical protein WEB79_10205 [Thermoleophilaceae bacterium]